MMTEESKGMKDAGSPNVKSRSNEALTMHRCYNFSHKSRFETTALAMICSLIEHGILSVFSMAGK